MITQMLLLDFKSCGDSSCYACSDFGEKHAFWFEANLVYDADVLQCPGCDFPV